MMGVSVWLDAWGILMWKACWQGGLLVLAVWSMCRIIPTMSARSQCWLWRLAVLKFLAVFLLPTLVNLPWLPVPSVARPESGNQAIADAPSHRTERARPTRTEGVDVYFILGVVWASGFLISSSRIVSVWQEARQLRRSSVSCRHPAILEQFIAQCEIFHLKKMPQLLEIDGAGSPMLIGILRPAIVIPSETLKRLSAAELALVLGHELAHIRRTDLAWNLVASLVRAVFFFHPLVWLSQRQLSMAQEMAADGLAIAQQQHDPMGYGKLLVSVVSKLGSGRLIPVMSMGTAGPMESLTRRLIAMSLVGTTSRRVRIASALIFSVVMLFGLAPWQLVAADPRIQEKPVAAKPAADPVRYVAKVKFLQVAQKGTQSTTLNTEVAGTKGTPLKTALGGKNGITVKLEMEEMPEVSPAQYVAQFRVIEAKQDGKENVLSAPKLIVVEGQPAGIMMGESSADGKLENGIEIEFTVTELPPAGQTK